MGGESNDDANMTATADAPFRERAELLGAEDFDVPPALERGTTVGRYVILDELGSGGMGVVYRAYDPDLHRRVAIKLLHSGTGTVGSARMLREAQAMAQLSHPNVVAIHDVGTLGEHVYIAMEYVEGRTLAAWQQKRRPWREVLDAYVQAGKGLVAAHAEELVHRDFKPDNAMIDEAARVRVMDFGLARPWGVRGPEQPPGDDEDGTTIPEHTPLHSALTRDGSVLGTPAYMAPEQFSGLPTDARTDQFSFCVALWEALYGKRPFAGDHIAALRDAVIEGRITDPPPTKTPSGLEKLLRRGLSPEADARWPSLEALLAQLETYRAPPPNRRAALLIGLLSTGVLGLGGTLAMQEDDRCSGAPAEILETWNGARTSAIEARLAAVSHGASWDEHRVRIQDWSDAWVAGHTDACTASTVRGEQSPATMELRMACLRAARAGLDGTLAVLEEADAQIAGRLDPVLDGLPDVDRCAAVDQLSAGIEVPPEESVDAVASVRRQTAQSFALTRAGHFAQGIIVAQGAEKAAKDAGFEPAMVDVLLALAGAQLTHGDSDDALGTLRRAQRTASRNGMWDAAVTASGRMVYILAREKADLEQARFTAELALGMAEFTDNAFAQGALENARGSTLSASGRYDEAAAAYTRVFELWSTTERADGETLGIPLVNRATARQRSGQLDLALEDLLQALELFERDLGPQSALVTAAHSNLASLLDAMGRIEDAETHFRTAFEVRAATLPPTHPDLMASHQGMGNVHAYHGRMEESRRSFALAVDGFEAAFGAGHPDTVRARAGLAQILLTLGRADEATTQAQRAIADATEKLGEEHVSLALPLETLGRALTESDRPAEAVKHHERALALYEGTAGRESPETVQSRAWYVQTLLRLGRLEDAEREARAAVADGREGNPATLMARARLGEVLLGADRREEAIAELQAAWAAFGRGRPRERAEVAFSLARALGADSTQGRTLAQDAKTLYAEDTLRTEAIDAWLASGGAGL